MPFNSSGKNLMLNAWKGTNPATPVAYASLHSAIPDDTGSNEISGGSPAYARKSATFNAASSGSIGSSNAPAFDVPASTTIVAVGFWSAVTAGTFLGWAPLNGSVKNVATVDAASDVLTSHSHGFANGDQIYLTTVTGESLPTGLSASTIYYVVNTATDTFKVSLTSGGSAVDITANGELFAQKVVPEVFGAQGTLTVSTSTLDLNA